MRREAHGATRRVGRVCGSAKRRPSLVVLLIGYVAHASAAYLPAAAGGRLTDHVVAAAARSGVARMYDDFDPDMMLGPGQKFGPTLPAHPADKCAHARQYF